MLVTWFLSTITIALFTYSRMSPLKMVPTLFDGDNDDHNRITWCHVVTSDD